MAIEKIFVIGDVHGCLQMLKRLIDKIDWQPEKDKLIFLGDYIDRGRDPKGVVDHILSLIRCSPHVEPLMGNHEAMFLDYLAGMNRNLFLINGGSNTIESYRTDNLERELLIPQDHLAFYQSLKTYVEVQDYYVVHAGFRPGVAVKEQVLEDMIWIREPFISSDYDFGKRVIFGHTPFHHPLIMDNKIGLDTGAVYGNRLTCLELTQVQFHFVEA